jgi:hypothetical protein
VQSYELLLHEEAWTALSGASKPERQRLFAHLGSLKDDPFREGDFPEQDACGRRNQVLLLDEWLITYWSDHAAREVRVLALERMDD